MLFSTEAFRYYKQILEELNMTDTTEPAGAERFTAASYPNAPIKTAASDPPPPPTLEERVAALEAVVYAITPANHLTAPGHVGAWLKRVGARIEAEVKKVL
jgi:hypothetical protein